ncbi:MAG: CapA family protein [Bacteroidales bacterium]|nr:CapA family protein [Bacteroidales bacterium]
MRRFFTFAIFLTLPVLVVAQIHVSVPPARPLRQLPDTATILVMGDVMMHRDQISNAARPDGTYDFSTYLANIKPMIEKADLSIANMEFTLAGSPYTGYPCFSAPDGYEDYVASCGVDVFLTANNHILDKGKHGLERTLSRYSDMESSGIVKHTGVSSTEEDDRIRFPLMVAVKGVRVALVNFTYGTNIKGDSDFPKVHLTDKKEIEAAVRRARRSGADFVIALPHWGTEYVLSHSSSQEALADWLAGIGCDAVIGAHPHVVQDCGMVSTFSEGSIKKVPVVYSLGNIVSNMSATNTQVGMIACLSIVTDEDGVKTMLPPRLIFTWCTRPGTLTDSYATVPVKDFIDKKELWKRPADHDNMVRSYLRVKAQTGIED